MADVHIDEAAKEEWDLIALPGTTLVLEWNHPWDIDIETNTDLTFLPGGMPGTTLVLEWHHPWEFHIFKQTLIHYQAPSIFEIQKHSSDSW